MVAVVVLRRLGDGSAAGMICLILSTALMRLEACRGAEDAMAGWVGSPEGLGMSGIQLQTPGSEVQAWPDVSSRRA